MFTKEGTLARGSESRIYSHKVVCMYVHMWVGHAQECHAECRALPRTIGIAIVNSSPSTPSPAVNTSYLTLNNLSPAMNSSSHTLNSFLQ